VNGLDEQSELLHEYERRFSGSAAYRQRVWQVLTSEFFQRYVPREGAVLDLGCGWGEFINNIVARARYGMDLNPSSAGRLDPSVTFFHQDCSRRWPLRDGTLDVIFTSNFFEHLADKAALRRTLDEALRCLRDGGRIVCLGPNVKYVPGAYWDFWDHHLPLTELALEEVLSLTGFRVDECRGRFLPYTMSRGFQPPTALVSAYLKLPLLWRFVGKQFLVVGSKAA
jgi:SAM-dependent methyltransferase